MDERVIEDRRARDEGGHVFATRVAEEEVVGEEGDEEESCSEEHWVVLGGIDYRGHFFLFRMVICK